VATSPRVRADAPRGACGAWSRLFQAATERLAIVVQVRQLPLETMETSWRSVSIDSTRESIRDALKALRLVGPFGRSLLPDVPSRATGTCPVALLERSSAERGAFGLAGLGGLLGAAALDPMDFGRGEAQGRADLVGHDLDLLERCSPSSVSQLRCSIRPVTTTRMPLRLSAKFSARSRQQMTSKKDVDSCHSRVVLSCQRRFTATPSWAVAWPSRALRVSGSRVRFPMMVVVLLMGASPSLGASFLANDAAASFDERPSPPAPERGPVPARAARRAEQELLGVPAGRTSPIAKPPEVLGSRAGDLTS